MKSADIFKIHNIGEFLDDIISLHSQFCDDTDGNQQLFFRGHASMDWTVTPTIFREDNLSYEMQMCRDFKLEMPNEFKDLKTHFDGLTKMQHYSMPTRLLDVTTNPLVALYFACLSVHDTKYSMTGEVLIFAGTVNFPDDIMVQLLSNISNYSVKEGIHAKQVAKGLSFDDSIEPEEMSKKLAQNLFVIPRISHERLLQQNGAFILFGNGIDTSGKMRIEKRTLTLDPMCFYGRDEKRFIIDEKDKERILRQLKIIGVHEASLFPGLDTRAKYIASRYLFSNSHPCANTIDKNEMFSWGEYDFPESVSDQLGACFNDYDYSGVMNDADRRNLIQELSSIISETGIVPKTKLMSFIEAIIDHAIDTSH